MKRALTAVVGAAAIAAPVANAAAVLTKKPKVKPKKRVVTVSKTVTGDPGFAGRWGDVQVTLIVKKTTTILGRKKTVARRIAKVDVPVFPDHTDRSVFINQQALPMLVQEVLQAQFSPNIDWISGATDTSNGFIDSLQSALLLAKKV
ncbi:MAG TPA: FMN-binding protein [Gaiellaceae bacterium]|nr:FMN-binding protein [Gaiellaceae bacterium]